MFVRKKWAFDIFLHIVFSIVNLWILTHMGSPSQHSFSILYRCSGNCTFSYGPVIQLKMFKWDIAAEEIEGLHQFSHKVALFACTLNAYVSVKCLFACVLLVLFST